MDYDSLHQVVLIWTTIYEQILNLDRERRLRTHEGYIPNSLRPKFKSQSQIYIWDVDIKT